MIAATTRQPIAIIGVSALFPGSTDATGFWRDILAGRDLIGDVPAGHWRIEDYYDPDPATPDKTYARRGGFLPKVDFDALGFGLPPATLPATDTSQLLALIVAQQVLRDAAREAFEGMDRSRISVILGVTSAQELLFSLVSRLQRPVWEKSLREAGIPESEVQDACARIAAHYVPWQEASFPGLLGNVVAGRIANRLNLGGSNCVVDAACASSLSALAMAVAELELGHSDLAIAGGVDTLNDIFMYLCFSKTPALSPTGDCRPFSDAADGTMLGEGLGMFALKRLVDAERDGDRIYAVLRGLGSSSDGRSKSVYAPVSEGQAQALSRAYAQAGYSPRTVELVEAHGTGTKAGDLAEFNGLKLAYEDGDQIARAWCALGSVKSQIGHTKAAAGAAGLFKIVMALHHKVLPPTIKVQRPDPRLALAGSPFYLNTRARPWIRGGDHPRRAAVSAFGFGGSNFHATVEEYTGATRAERLPVQRHELVLVCADDADTLLARIAALASPRGPVATVGAGSPRDRTGEPPTPPQPLARIAHHSRADWNPAARHRLALVADSLDSLRTRLAACAERIRRAPEAAFDGADGCHGVGPPGGGVAFLFPGQGSQYLGMGGELAMQFECARSVWDRAAALELDDGLRLHDIVYPPPAFEADAQAAQRARLTATEHAQPALAAHSAALLALLDELGVRADACGGHSFGELMALHAAGSYDLATALGLARARGLAMRDAARAPGAMSAVAARVEKVRELLAGQREVIVANHNGPRQVVVSGPLQAVADFEALASAAGLACTRLPVASAFHSPIVAGASAAFGAALARADLRPPQLPVWANAEAAPYAGDEETLRGQLAVQLSRPVRFVEMIEAMHAAGIRHFVEVGPGQVLSGLVGAILGARPHQAIALDRKGGDGIEAMLQGLARLAAAGALTRPGQLYADVRLPPPVQARAKHAIAIDGSNLGKPYPPPPGSPWPAPNPERPQRTEDAAAPTTPDSVRTPSPAPAAPDSVRTLSPAPVGPDSVRTLSPRPAAATGPDAVMTEPPSDAWLAAFQDSQRQAAAAHAAFQQAMADSHAAYLKLTETALAGLAALAGAPVPTQEILEAVPVRTAKRNDQGSVTAQIPDETAASRGMHPLPPSPPDLDASPLPRSLPELEASAIPQPPPESRSLPDLPALLLAVVADKTGYPAEMLSLEMDLEGDLGIDSIKRVEILAAVDERAPELPKVDRARLGAMRTLAEIVTALGGTEVAGAAVGAGSPRDQGSGTAEVPVETAVPGRGVNPLPPSTRALEAGAEVAPRSRSLPDLPALLLAVVADKTGYPAEMLSLEMDLEGDLGIDSIKRVEILAAVDERAPELPKVDRARLGAMRTLAEIVAALGGTEVPGTPVGAGSPRDQGTGTAEVPVETAVPGRGVNPLPQSIREPGAPPRLARYELELIPAPAAGLALAGLLGGGSVHVLGHDTLAPALAAELQRRGVEACAVLRLPADADAAIHLGGLRDFADTDAAIALNHEVFAVARQLAQRGPRLFVSVQDSGGSFGLEGGDARRAWAAGLPALAKTAALEWPQAALKAIDLERSSRDAQALAHALADELLGGGGEIEVALGADGRRRTLRSVARPARPEAPVIADAEVVVVSGGARGVTAACLVEWARSCRARFVLLGRSELAEGPRECAGIVDEAGLGRVLLASAQVRGQVPTPAVLQARVRAVLQAREVRATLAALVAAGAHAEYRAVSVDDAGALARTLDDVRRTVGPIRGLVHAAGVLADKRIGDKTDAQFDAVLRTKVHGLRALLDATAGDELRLLALFSSVSARCGNTGQADYAMANEVLAKVALAQARARPGLRVKSFGWGPWEGGMVNPALRARFAQLGVPMLPLATGAAMFVDELADASGAVELVLGGEPRPQALLADGADARVEALELKIDAASHGFLAGHAVAGEPVVPMVLVAEWLARAVQGWRPGLRLVALHDLKVLKGIRLRRFGNGGDRLRIEGRALADGRHIELRVLGAGGEAHYRARAELGESVAAPQSAPALRLDAWSGAPLYQELLFHRGRFELIDAVDGISDEGIAARLRGIADAAWPDEEWQLDAAALDAGLQLAVLYGRRMLGGANLPMGIDQLRTHAAPAAGPLRALAHARRVGAGATTTDIYLDDAHGNRVAELLGVHNVAVAG